ncbi:hypothetical protein [Klebsiella phage vB_Kpn_3]|nr:hypothetical protein [Klebsiella phage vB_Kpn_3]
MRTLVLPCSSRHLSLAWVEDKQTVSLVVYVFFGFQMLGMWFEKNVLVCELFSPKSLVSRVMSTFQAVCEHFYWEGKTQMLFDYYEVK